MSRLEKLQAFLAADPTDSFTRYAIGLEFASAKNYPDAIKALEELRDGMPNYLATYYQLASYYREIGEKEQALATYAQGINVARNAKDLHAMSELQAALDELEDEG